MTVAGAMKRKTVASLSPIVRLGLLLAGFGRSAFPCTPIGNLSVAIRLGRPGFGRSSFPRSISRLPSGFPGDGSEPNAPLPSRNGGGITATMVPPLSGGKVFSSKADHDDKSGPVSPDAPSRQGSSTRISSSAGSLCCMAASKGGRQVCGKLRARVGKRQVGLVSTCGSCGHAGSHVLREIMYTCAERVWCLLSLPC